MNKLIQITTLTLGIALSGCATASPHWDDARDEHKHRRAFEDTARVIRVTPIYETVRVSIPEERCWKEQYYQRSDYGHDDSYTPPIVGAIVGGVVGNQFGRGSGKTAMTVAGSLLGASIARDLSRSEQPVDYRPRQRRRCEVTERVEEHEEIVAYRVKYRYRGHVFHTRMNHHPGKHIQVRVAVQPID